MISSAGLDQDFTEKHLGSFCGWFIYERSVVWWLQQRMPQAALQKSLVCEQQPGHTLLEQGPGMMLLGVIPYSLPSNLASVILTLRWLQSLRNLHGYSCSKMWCWHTSFAIKVYTWAVSPLSERYARQKRPLKLFLPLWCKSSGFRHVSAISQEVFGLPRPGWLSEVNPYPQSPAVASIVWFIWELDAWGKTLDHSSASHTATLEICCAREHGTQAPQHLCWSDHGSSQTCQAVAHWLAQSTWGTLLCQCLEGAEGETHPSLPSCLASSGSLLHKNGAPPPAAELLWSQPLAGHCVGANQSPKPWAHFSWS